MEHEKQITLTLLPYTRIVGQEKLKLALELAYIAPRIGGVLISGKRGTAKSTTVRAFANMMYKKLPVTIPINATEDRVVGGWDVHELVSSKAKKQMGLLEQANGQMIYIDEVNLLDDHIVNILLDVTSTGKLVIQREGLDEQLDIEMTLVGTMNPEEGGLRPQLLDRFGLMVGVEEVAEEERFEVLQTVLDFDRAVRLEKKGETAAFLQEARKEADGLRKEIEGAKGRLEQIQLCREAAKMCIKLAQGFRVEGHRSDYLLALAASAYAARRGDDKAEVEHVGEVADLVLRHRQAGAQQLNYAQWGEQEQIKLVDLLDHV